jgi:hypothetical protein
MPADPLSPFGTTSRRNPGRASLSQAGEGKKSGKRDLFVNADDDEPGDRGSDDEGGAITVDRREKPSRLRRKLQDNRQSPSAGDTFLADADEAEVEDVQPVAHMNDEATDDAEEVTPADFTDEYAPAEEPSEEEAPNEPTDE